MKRVTLRTAVLALSFVITSLAPRAEAATDVFFNIDGIPGQSSEPAYPDWMQLVSWNITIRNTNPVKHADNGKSAGGKAGSGEISITKLADQSTTSFHSQCCNGKHYPSAMLIVRKANQPGSEYVLIALTDLIITSVSTSGSGGADEVTETVTLDFGSFKTDYQPQSEDGPDGPPVDYGWKADKKS